jgi:hypothetical protein
METINDGQCPNCWGYQEYDEKYPERQLCQCPKDNK